MGLVNETMRIEEIKGLMESMNLNDIKMNLSAHDMRRHTQRLELLNNNQEYLKDSILSSIHDNIQTTALKTMETILYDNTKLKLKSAQSRCESAEKVVEVIYDILLTSELIWLIMQLDLDKRCTRIYDMNKLMEQSALCEKRIEIMLQNMSKNPDPEKKNRERVIRQMRNLLNGTQQPNDDFNCTDVAMDGENYDLKTLLYDYRKFTDLLKYNTMNFIKGKHYIPFLDKCKEV